MANFCILGVFLFAFVVGQTTADCGECPEGWLMFRDFCYKRTGYESYMDAKADCAALGAQLAAPHDADEANFMITMIHPYLWVGCNDIDTEGTFVCCDGTVSTYTNWRAGEPNDAQSNGGEDCGVIYGNGDYNDINCSWSSTGVCKKHVTAFL
ncbi:low affinity immunoglobulin epsilon Fc receptor-like [Patiria miniata]|uniref:C-type lectin domain-containing protein n=1 Tax=Patiria miniata TaxID=46514 RepID=A0A914AXF6_PATMI|nr:low affinity immunoglobulin epsilon Fc receptor-like [Patiria miniata]